jgi:hypothetical protein
MSSYGVLDTLANTSPNGDNTSKGPRALDDERPALYETVDPGRHGQRAAKLCRTGGLQVVLRQRFGGLPRRLRRLPHKTFRPPGLIL